jgi:hypothetical protein
VKYTPDQLRDMAQICMAAKAQNDARYLQVVMQLVLRLGIAPAQAMEGIALLAQAAPKAEGAAA